MAQGDLVAAALFRLSVEVAPPHPGAEVAGVLLCPVGDGENIRLEHVDGDIQHGGVFLDPPAVLRAVARVHHQIGQLEGKIAVALEQAHQQGQEHRILPAGNADGHMVARGKELIPLDGMDKRRPQLLAEPLVNAALDQLQTGQFVSHTPSRVKS